MKSTHGHRFPWLPGLAGLGAALGLSCVAQGSPSDEVELTNVPSTSMAILLNGMQGPSGGSGSWCLKDYKALVAGAATVHVPVGNFIPSTGGSCPAEVAVFAYDRAMLLDDNPGWTNAPSDVVVAPLGSSLAVSLNVWVPAGSATALPFAQAEVVLAGALYMTTNRTGLSLNAAYNATTATFMGTSNGCADVTTIKTAGPPVYQSDRLNVYFVQVILNPAGGGITDFGRNCFPSAANVMFVSVSDHIPVTLAHEIGHGLSLEHTGTGNFSYTGFTSTNVMYNAGNLTAAQPRSDFSLGQAYRLNVHNQSWLNSPVGSATPVRTGPTRTCQSITATTGPCPLEALAWP